eukprot:8710223-Pyramimonas_sp.AAC.1
MRVAGGRGWPRRARQRSRSYAGCRRSPAPPSPESSLVPLRLQAARPASPAGCSRRSRCWSPQ